MSTNKQFKNLVFEGGGVKGVAYIGAIEVLSEKNLLEDITGVAGNSAGAITACLLSLQYSASEINKIVFEMDFKSFEDDKNYRRVKSEYGLYAGDTFLEWMTDLIVKKGFAPSATFQDLKDKGCLDLKVYATDLYTKSLQEFSLEKTPNTIVAEAVRASMSIPLFFKVWKFSNNLPNDHLYVDGGVLLNYPLNAFDKNQAENEKTLGFRTDNLSKPSAIDAFGYKDLKAYTKALFETMLVAQNVIFKENTAAVKSTVQIDDMGISATNFDLTEADKNALIREGRKATEGYLRRECDNVVM